MDMIRAVLLVATLLCSLVAGFVFAFAIVVMPGIRNLNDHDFLQSFKEMDGVIQNNHPLFMVVWIGSILTLLASALLGIWQLEGLDRFLLLSACAIYLFGVQAPTAAINIPLNNALQSKNLAAMNEHELQDLRARFESRWVRWNTIRTVLAVLTTAVLLILLIRVGWE